MGFVCLFFNKTMVNKDVRGCKVQTGREDRLIAATQVTMKVPGDVSTCTKMKWL